MKSNLSVGLPINLSTLRNNANEDPVDLPKQIIYDEENTKFIELRKCWDNGLKKSFDSLPDLEWFSKDE